MKILYGVLAFIVYLIVKKSSGMAEEEEESLAGTGDGDKDKEA